MSVAAVPPPAWVTRRLDGVLTAVTVVAVGASLAMRIVHRGAYYPGWDVVGAANGLFYLSTKTADELVRMYAQRRWLPGFWNVVGVPGALLPGFLASVWPWERWPHVITPCLAALALGLTARALDLRLRTLWMVLLPLGASPALMSYVVAGLPYVSNVLPHAVALWVVLRWRESLVGTVLLTLGAIGISWHTQELGRIAFAVLVAAALTLPAVRSRIRAAWFLGGAAWCWLAAAYPTANTLRHTGMAPPPLSTWPEHAVGLARHFLEAKPDYPVLTAAGFAAAMCVPRERWFWSAVLLVQVALLFMLASNTGIIQGLHTVWPRRTLVLSFTALAACAAALRHRRPWTTGILVAVLAGGHIWQLGATVQWARRPLDADATPGYTYTLPFTYTPLAAGPVERVGGLDSRVSFLLVDWHDEMRAELAKGRKLLLIYNLISWDENAANPAGIIDRLYLGLGHEGFSRSVFVFGNNKVMVRELPIRPMATFEEFVASLEDPSEWRAYWVHGPNDEKEWPIAEKHRAEVTQLFTGLERRFRLEWEPSSRDRQGRSVQRFSLHLRDAPGEGGR